PPFGSPGPGRGVSGCRAAWCGVRSRRARGGGARRGGPGARGCGVAYRAVLVGVDYDPARRWAVVRDVVGQGSDLPTPALAEAAASQLLLEGGPPRADRHAVVVDTGAPGGTAVVAIVELDPALEPVVLRPRTDDD